MKSDQKSAGAKLDPRGGPRTGTTVKHGAALAKFVAEAGRVTPQDLVGRYADVAALVVSPPPTWLAQHFSQWALTLTLRCAVTAVQPSRAEMIEELDEIEVAARVIRRLIDRDELRNFLEIDAGAPMASLHGPIQKLMDELITRADAAKRSRGLVSSTGKSKPGPGPALPPNAISAEALCAVVVVEAWRYFEGQYPSPRNAKAWRVAEVFWRAAGFSRNSWGANKLTAWRRHFEQALSDRYEDDRNECCRHMRNWELSESHGDS